MNAVFIYSTLRYPPLFTLVAGPGDLVQIAARLDGFAVERVQGARSPMLVPRAGAQAQGVVLRGVSPARMARLALFDLPVGDWFAPVTVQTDAGPVAAQVCLARDGLVSDGTPWVLDDWVATDAAVTLLVARELAATDPWPDAAGKARQWPMIQARADAAMRARAQTIPATLRHAAVPDDVVWQDQSPLVGQFFRYATIALTHRRFDGTRSPPLPREVLVGVDAAVVLPYDPVRDRVLLVEQVRTGPTRRGDPNPWCLEPVAGIVDAGETPHDAAMRECAEEAGLVPDRLEPMFAIYASPGSSTDYFHCFLGLADLPDTLPRRGGLEEEDEDLRLHLVALDDALALIDTGEANAGQLVAMLLWLARHRDRIRNQSGMSNPGGASSKPSN